ncbi:UNVERIFIED_CONTAM: hypothetical protein K2H54_039633 [Gekko kuhli]
MPALPGRPSVATVPFLLELLGPPLRGSALWWLLLPGTERAQGQRKEPEPIALVHPTSIPLPQRQSAKRKKPNTPTKEHLAETTGPCVAFLRDIDLELLVDGEWPQQHHISLTADTPELYTGKSMKSQFWCQRYRMGLEDPKTLVRDLKLSVGLRGGRYSIDPAERPPPKRGAEPPELDVRSPWAGEIKNILVESRGIRERITQIDTQIIIGTDPLVLDELVQQRTLLSSMIQVNEEKIQHLTREEAAMRDDTNEDVLDVSSSQTLTPEAGERGHTQRCHVQTPVAMTGEISLIEGGSPEADDTSPSEARPAKKKRGAEQEGEELLEPGNKGGGVDLSVSPQAKLRVGTPKGVRAVRETRLAAAWVRTKARPISEGLQLLVPDSFGKIDLAKFWGLLLAHIALPDAPTIQLNKRSKDYMIDLLDSFKQTLMDFLTGSKARTPGFMDRVIYARSLSLNVVDRFVIGRKARTSMENYPLWLSEKGLTTLLGEIHRSWESRSPEEVTDIHDSLEGERAELSPAAWMYWCQQAIQVLKVRTDRMKGEVDPHRRSLQFQAKTVPGKAGHGKAGQPRGQKTPVVMPLTSLLLSPPQLFKEPRYPSPSESGTASTGPGRASVVSLMEGEAVATRDPAQTEGGDTTVPAFRQTGSDTRSERRADPESVTMTTTDLRRAQHTTQGDAGFQSPPQTGEDGDGYLPVTTGSTSKEGRGGKSERFRDLPLGGYRSSQVPESSSEMSGIESFETSGEEEGFTSDGEESDRREEETLNEGRGVKAGMVGADKARKENQVRRNTFGRSSGGDGGDEGGNGELKRHEASVLAFPCFVPPVPVLPQPQSDRTSSSGGPLKAFGTSTVGVSPELRGHLGLQPLPQRQGEKRKKPPDFVSPSRSREGLREEEAVTKDYQRDAFSNVPLPSQYDQHLHGTVSHGLMTSTPRSPLPLVNVTPPTGPFGVSGGGH